MREVRRGIVVQQQRRLVDRVQLGSLAGALDLAPHQLRHRAHRQARHDAAVAAAHHRGVVADQQLAAGDLDHLDRRPPQHPRQRLQRTRQRPAGDGYRRRRAVLGVADAVPDGRRAGFRQRLSRVEQRFDLVQLDHRLLRPVLAVAQEQVDRRGALAGTHQMPEGDPVRQQRGWPGRLRLHRLGRHQERRVVVTQVGIDPRHAVKHPVMPDIGHRQRRLEHRDLAG